MKPLVWVGTSRENGGHCCHPSPPLPLSSFPEGPSLFRDLPPTEPLLFVAADPTHQLQRGSGETQPSMVMAFPCCWFSVSLESRPGSRVRGDSPSPHHPTPLPLPSPPLLLPFPSLSPHTLPLPLPPGYLHKQVALLPPLRE